MTATEPRRDRRHARRQETLTELVDVALQVMSEQGAAGLSLGEVARRMGMRPPSLYVYFPSKNAVYDAVFTQGWQALLADMRQHDEGVEEASDLGAYLLALGTSYVRWSVEHPTYTQLMAWRPVPGYEPSAEAYVPAVATIEATHQVFARLQQRGLLCSDVPVEHLLRSWTVLLSGIVTQQLANAPQEPFESGRFTALLPDVVQMYVKQYGAPASVPVAPEKGHRHGRNTPL